MAPKNKSQEGLRLASLGPVPAPGAMVGSAPSESRGLNGIIIAWGKGCP